MGAIDGKHYLKRIDGLNNEIWINGEKVEGPLSVHPAFKGVMASQAKLYDLQHDQSLKNKMTYTSPETGEQIGPFYFLLKRSTLKNGV